jgi:hypothetical protein
VRKREGLARAEYLAALDLEPGLRSLAEASEDAFDAAVSAMVMSRSGGWHGLARPADPVLLLEGAIWTPTLGTDPT